MIDSPTYRPSAGGWLDGFGLVPRLLALTLAAVLLTAATVGYAVLVEARQHGMAQMQQALNLNLGLLKALLERQGREWRRDGDRLLLDGQPVNDRFEAVDRVRQLAGGVATLFAGDLRVSTNVMRSEGGRATGTRLAQGPAYDAVLRRGETYSGRAPILGREHLTIYEPLRDPSGQVVGILFVGLPVAEALEWTEALAWDALLSGLGVAVVAGLLAWLLLRLALRPLRALTGAVQRIGAGEFEAPVPCTGRRDQLGEIGRAVLSLGEGAAAARRLQQEAEANRARQAQERRSLQQGLGDTVEQAVGGVAAALAEGVAKLQQAGEAAGQGTARAEREAGGAAAQAQGATDNVQAVAAAAEQLAASIAEITRRVAEGAATAQQAVAAAASSDTTVAGLSEAADRIGDVVKLIADIAGQTNLLALNATIEAARAGEAGKGFAVVASEVKNLAAQTAKATEEIGSQIAAMRQATGQAVQAVRGIAEAVSRMDGVTTAIAAAVEQQGAATQEIARNAAAAAAGTQAAAQGTAALGAHVASASAALHSLREATGLVAGQGRALQQELSGVVQRLRAS